MGSLQLLIIFLFVLGEDDRHPFLLTPLSLKKVSHIIPSTGHVYPTFGPGEVGFRV